jgi:hypothetical protein
MLAAAVVEVLAAPVAQLPPEAELPALGCPVLAQLQVVVALAPPVLVRRPAVAVVLRAVRLALLAVEVVSELLLRLSRQSFSAAMARSTP